MNKAFVSHFWKPVKCDIAVTLPLSLLHNTLSGLNIFIMKKKNRCSAVKKGKIHSWLLHISPGIVLITVFYIVYYY